MKGNRPSTKEYLIDGTPYVDGKDFKKVQISGYSKNVQSLRYNAFEDEMEFELDGQTYFANQQDNLKIFFPQLNKTYKNFTYNLEGKSKSGYLILIREKPKYSLYKREKMELLKGEKSPNAYSKDANDYYAKEKDLYLISVGDQLMKIPKNLNDISEVLAIDKNKLTDFSKKNKININKETDLIKLIDFLNE